jgi:hypothetical protein
LFKKRDYRSQHNFDYNNKALKEKAKDMETDSKKFHGLSSINKETNKHENETNLSAYNMLGKQSEMRSPVSIKKLNLEFDQIEEE